MSIEQLDKIDFLHIDQDSGELLLTVTDHLPWECDEGQHLFLLQEKLNAYIRFIESGEIITKFPDALGRKVVINVIGKFPLSDKAAVFFDKAQSAIQASGSSLRFKVFQP